MPSSSLSAAARPRASRVVIIALDLDLTLERYLYRAGQPDVLPDTAPVYPQLAAAHAHAHAPIEPSAPHRNRDGRTGAGAAAERLARAALVHAQPYLRARDDLEKAGVHALRKARVALDQRPEGGDRDVVDRCHGHYRVGVAERDDHDLESLTTHFQRIAVRLGRGLEGERARIEIGHPEIDRHRAVRREACANHSGRAVERELTVAGATAAPEESREAAGTVATLLDLGAVGVEDPVVRRAVRAPRRIEQQRLVEADAGAAIRQCPQPGRIEEGIGDRRIEHNEVVADPVHLR